VLTSQQEIILNNYNICQNNFPDISAGNSIFTVFTDENNEIPPIYVPILQKLEMIHRKTGKKTYEIISGSDLEKYNRCMNYVNWSKQNNMNLYTHENDSDGFTVGGQPVLHPGPVFGTIILAIGAGVTCTQYFKSGKDEDKTNCKLLSKTFVFGCFMCWATSESPEKSNIARRLTRDQLVDINARLTRDLDADPVNLDRPPTIISDELAEQLSQRQIDELENHRDPTVELTEQQEEQVQMTSVVEANEGASVYGIEGALLEEAEVVGEVDEELLEGPE